jgi:hypothetical protein
MWAVAAGVLWCRQFDSVMGVIWMLFSYSNVIPQNIFSSEYIYRFPKSLLKRGSLSLRHSGKRLRGGDVVYPNLLLFLFFRF